ncbi:bifunctional folylpolyglutamate synthase/dihydrofolate synthase [Agromyces mangrovi Wang et al. 2018]|uniref:bifunctional folylpolyglutamate synthase/dihydrofolate synthase n=1 Tax=Agromyces mangrovi TaxID=1858653 RepID=UPI002572E2D4|nr:Mur ligase family protein [Agromyces mangrovi]BDZ66446.1 dihydrofolate synthase [Agromyces mangrovi]
MTDEFRDAADAVFSALLDRIGEQAPQPRLGPSRRLMDLLGDPQRAYPVIHVTGTNGKTSTSRLIEGLLRAHGLRTGLLTSPHIERFTERILVDGEPISDEAVARNWDDITPYVEMVDAELEQAGDVPLTYFEALSALAFAAFADAPVDVAVIEVGMGGEWDSTNVADGQVAVFTPIDLDHMSRLGSTVTQIARTKSGIIKPAASVVSARQSPEATDVLATASRLSEATLAIEGDAFETTAATVAVGGQLLSIRGIAGEYAEVFLPLLGAHQAQNAAVAVAAVESFLGSGEHALSREVVEEAFATTTSPGRMQLVGVEPTVLVDAAHNPHGAHALVEAVRQVFDFDEIAVVVGVLGDKDAAGILRELDAIADVLLVTASESDRAIPAEALAQQAAAVIGPERISSYDRAEDAFEAAHDWAAEAPRRAVVVTGSITLVAEAMAFADDREWKP